jgi:hypothetical protein
MKDTCNVGIVLKLAKEFTSSVDVTLSATRPAVNVPVDPPRCKRAAMRWIIHPSLIGRPI